MSLRHHSILSTVGNTPVVKINKLAPSHVNLYVKIEAFNPMGSVKDRLALGVIEDAERSGALQPGQTVIEATSGNTGIGLAMVCARKGYPLVVTMAENFSIERRKMMRFLGARVVLTPASLKGSGMLAKAVELAQTHGWFLCRQFENEANARVHAETTAPEILAAFADEQLHFWVSGYGTGGTVNGVARVLKAKSPATRIVVCEPDNSPLLGSGSEQHRSADGSPAESHSAFRPHLMQGWTPDFISLLTEDALQYIDDIVPVAGLRALEYARRLAREEGIFCGITGGATFAAALSLAEQAPAGSNILCMLPDTGERYLTTPLFEDIAEDMDEAEWEISRSSPGARFDPPPEATQVANEDESSDAKTRTAPLTVPVTAEGRDFVSQVLEDNDQPVVLFALEWCEFCWSVRKMFARAGIAYRSVDLDSAELQHDDQGGKIRAALQEKTGCLTIPQIFVGGEFIGGCSEVFDAWQDRSLQRRLEAQGMRWNRNEEFDAYSMLPGWLHKRS